VRLGLIPESVLDRVMLAFGVGPPPAMTEAYAPLHARAIVAATEMGVFDALAGGERSAAEVASACGMDARASEQLLNFLVSMRYLRYRRGGYELSRQARRWLLKEGEGGIRDLILMKRLEWRWIEGLEGYLRTGVPANVHGTMSPEDWQTYQRGMRAQASVGAPMLARLLPIPKGARDLLDIGGSHGYWSVVLCRRHPNLRATVLDLPDAVAHAAPLLEREGMGDRVVLRAGDALTDDIGTDAYDVVLMFSLVHHFDESTNRRLVSRAAAALRPGGRMIILEPLRAEPGGGQQGAFFDLYFGLTSESGTWTLDEMRTWQVEAGLEPRSQPFPMRFVKDFGLAIADKPAVRD
jgi:SAM-dependent methyltransferase